MQGAPPSSQMIQPNQYAGMTQGYPIGVVPSTNAVAALVLSIVGVIGAFFYGIGLIFSIPALVLASKARKITTQLPGHPDSGMATAAFVTAWVGVVIGGLYVLLIIGLMMLFVFAFEGGF